MQLEDYFDFFAPDDIRIKGTRIGIESILYEYVYNKHTPEAIKERFHTVSLEQVYATILYYLHNKETVDAYLTDYLEYCRIAREEYVKNPPSVIKRLRRIKERLEGYPPEERNAALQRILAAEKKEQKATKTG